MWDQIRPTGGKKGRKHSVLVDARGVPLSIVASGANRHDSKLLEATLKNKMAAMPNKGEHHLNGDWAYRGKALEKIMRDTGYLPHIRKRTQEREEKLKNPEKKARRWDS